MKHTLTCLLLSVTFLLPASTTHAATGTPAGAA